MTDNPPDILFKYLVPDRVDILANEKIAFTPPERFNDILDVRPQVQPITSRQYLRQREKEAKNAYIRSLPASQKPKSARQLKRFRKHLKGAIEHVRSQAPDLASKWERDLPKLISQNFGILCLSEINNFHPMWAHYADEHKGFVLELDTRVESFRQLGQLRKVKYLPSPPVYDPAKGAKGFWYQKLDQWAEEKEWRMVRELEHCDQVQVKDTTIYLSAFPRIIVKSVYIGARISPVTEQNIRRIISGTHIRLFRARADIRSGNFVFEKCSR
jgi:hypothetical protein